MIIQAHAKINLAIRVLDKTKDGYHNLDMVMVPITLHDTLEITLVPADVPTYLTCNDLTLTTDETNLCLVAVNKMREKFHFKENLRIHLTKRIPISSGLGGGSSDAASTMNAIVELLKLKTKEKQLIKIARSIGSDVPFFLKSIPARVMKTGEVLKPIKVSKLYHLMLVKPVEGLSTKEVFGVYDRLISKDGEILSVIKALETGDDELLTSSLFNALEPASSQLCPKVKEIKQSLISEGFNMVLMSGSGSSVYALSGDKRLLELKKAKFVKLGHQVFITQLLG